MSEKITQITKDTVIPLGLVALLIGGMVGGAYKVGRLTLQVEQHEKILTNVATKEDIIRIEKAIDNLSKAEVSNVRTQ